MDTENVRSNGWLDDDALALAERIPDTAVEQIGIVSKKHHRERDDLLAGGDSVDKLRCLNLQRSEDVRWHRSHRWIVNLRRWLCKGFSRSECSR